jgi:hypothetical protein
MPVEGTAEDLDPQLHRVRHHDHHLAAGTIAGERCRERLKHRQVTLSEIAATGVLLVHGSTCRHDDDIPGYFIGERRHLDGWGRLVKGIEQVTALGQQPTLRAFDAMADQLQPVGCRQHAAAEQVGGQRPSHRSRCTDDRELHGQDSFPLP